MRGLQEECDSFPSVFKRKQRNPFSLSAHGVVKSLVKYKISSCLTVLNGKNLTLTRSILDKQQHRPSSDIAVMYMYLVYLSTMA